MPTPSSTGLPGKDYPDDAPQWDLKWHTEYDIYGEKPVWPDWMKGFDDFWR